MFEKKNSKRARVKKKRKERKKDECVFLLVFSLAKKKFVSFTQNTTDIKYQIPHHHSFVARKKTHTYIYLLLSYINEFRGAQIGVTTHRRGRVRVVLFHPPRILIITTLRRRLKMMKMMKTMMKMSSSPVATV